VPGTLGSGKGTWDGLIGSLAMKIVKFVVITVVTVAGAIFVIRKVSFLNNLVFGAPASSN
jgi:hypothetical protein